MSQPIEKILTSLQQAGVSYKFSKKYTGQGNWWTEVRVEDSDGPQTSVFEQMRLAGEPGSPPEYLLSVYSIPALRPFSDKELDHPC